jgi:predicted HTH domain antitoxin
LKWRILATPDAIAEAADASVTTIPAQADDVTLGASGSDMPLPAYFAEGTDAWCQLRLLRTNRSMNQDLKMCELAMTIPDESPAALADSPEKAIAELRMLAAVKVFELKMLSSGAAARLAGVSRVEFPKRLGEYGVPVFDMSEKEFEQETHLG